MCSSKNVGVIDRATELADKAYAEEHKYALGLVEQVEALRPHLQVCGEIAVAFPEMTIRVGCGVGRGVVHGALLTLSGLTDMRQVVPIAKELVARGYHTKGKNDWPEIGRRTYDYGEIQVMCFLAPKTGAKCAWVKTGVKEEPVYELVCDDGEVIP